MDALVHDLRAAVRSLRKTPGFTAAAVVPLSLGIGANTALFSVVYGVLFRPFPYRDPGSLVIVSAERQFGGQVRRANFSALELGGWRERNRAFDGVAIWAATRVTLEFQDVVEPVTTAYVSSAFFQTLDQPMAIGRAIGPEDDHMPVVVISHRLWTRRFGSDPNVLGRSVTLDHRSYAVIGVTAATFQFPYERTSAWTPLGFAQALGTASWVSNPRGGGFNFVARLKHGVNLTQARADAEAVARTMTAEFPDMSAGRRPLVVPLSEWFLDTVRPALLVLLAAVGLVLLVACANVTNLMLARHAGRGRDAAVRRALGASRRRLAVEGLVEGAVLAGLGASAGILLAAALVVAS